MKKNIKMIIIVSLIYIYPTIVSASLEEMDKLITYFDKTLNGLSANDPMVPSLILRLADALTKRGQIKQSEEIIDEGYQRFKAGRADMKRALSLYISIQNKVLPQMRGHVFFQLGYINVLFENYEAAINAYSKVIRSNRWKDLKSKSYIALGELFYKINKFDKAKFHFSRSLKYEFPNKGFVIYKIAWCNYHLSQLDLAVKDLFKLLRSPKQFLLKDEASSIKEIDEVFHKEVAKDLAMFLSKKDPTNKEIEMLYRLSPRDKKVSNIIYLAKEFMRVGNKKKAISLWKKILPKQTQAMDKLESYTWLFQLFIETHQTQNVLQTIKSISQIWNTGVCNDLKETEKCKEFKERITQNITVWKDESKSDLSSILKVYSFYLVIFKDDIEATYQVADVAQKLQLWKLSRERYNSAIKMQKKLITETNGEQEKKVTEFLEVLLVGYIKTAELSKNKRWLLESYEKYLELSQNKGQRLKVSFLKAKLLYDQKNYKKAADDFISIAVVEAKEDASAQKIRLQSAYLAIEALVATKNDEQLEKASLNFAKRFSNQAAHFMKVNRTSIMNQALGSSKDPQRALQVLDRINLSGVAADEEIKYYKNKIILLDQLQRVSDEIQLVDQLLKIKNLSKEDKKFGLLRRSYLAELMLDFPTMYKINKEYNLEDLSTDQWSLRKAFFAELAEKAYIQHYHDFLKLSKDSQKKFDVALKLFKEAANQESFFKQYKKILLHNPKLLSDLLLDNYINDINKKQMSRILREFANTDAGKTVWRDGFLEKLGAIARQISQHQIRFQNTSFIDSDIKERFKLFENLEKSALLGINAKDIIAQLISFYFIKKEALRLYEDLNSIANSSQSLKSQKKEYLSVLEEQAKLYKEKATVIESQLKTLFNGAEVFDKLEEYLFKVSKPVQVISKSHLFLLVNYLPEESKPKLRSILKNITQLEDDKRQTTQPSDSVIDTAQANIRENPFNKQNIEKLIALEELRNNKTMVLYLKERRLVMLEE